MHGQQNIKKLLIDCAFVGSLYKYVRNLHCDKSSPQSTL